ncbi:MAG: hypothetical protein WAK18_00880 [Nocardioidaceae bacterium]
MSSEPVGSLAEEAAKLIAVVQGWAGEHDGHRDTADAETASSAGGAHEGHDEHHHDGSADPDCQWCPLCRVARAARATTPEVREHLATAALSLALAFKGLLDGLEHRPDQDPPDPVEKIDLDAPED